MIAASRSRCCVDLAVEVGQVDVAVVVAGHHDHPHAGHHGAGRVGAVRARRDQAHVAVGVATGPVVAADRQQPGQLALGPGVGLHAHRVVPGDLGQPRLQVGRPARAYPRVCVGRRERVHVGELGPGDRLHLGGRVELHRARARAGSCPGPARSPCRTAAQVAQHRRLGAVRVEHRVGQVVAGAAQRRRQRVGRPPAPRARRTPPSTATGAPASSSRRRRRRPCRRRPGAG